MKHAIKSLILLAALFLTLAITSWSKQPVDYSKRGDLKKSKGDLAGASLNRRKAIELKPDLASHLTTAAKDLVTVQLAAFLGDC